MNFNENQTKRDELECIRAVGIGTWRVTGFRFNWYVVTGQGKKIGPVQIKGTNYYDKAKHEAEQRNLSIDRKVRENNDRVCRLPY